MTTEHEDTRLTAYALGELSEPDRLSFEDELDEDAGLRRELLATEKTLDELRGELRQGDAPTLSDERRKIIEEHSRRADATARRRRPLLRAGAFVALAAGVAMFVGVTSRQERAVELTAQPVAAPSAVPAIVDELSPERGHPRAGIRGGSRRPVPRAQGDDAYDAFDAHRGSETGEDLPASPVVKKTWREEPPVARVLPAPRVNRELYDQVRDNPFVDVSVDPLSTFSIDVDTASYSLVRRHVLEQRVLPPPGAVRIEELVNYFDYAYAEPTDGRPFSVRTDVASAPWAPSHRLLRVGLKGKHVAPREIAAANLVFLIDVSGSMADENKLPLLKRGLSLMVERLRERDRVSIVVYAGSSGLVLPPTPGSNQRAILAALDRLDAGGSTNGGQGIALAYREAREGFVKGGVNRVILATDGDFNVGLTNQDELVALVERQAKSGVFLSVLGFGGGNYNDSMLEKLADKGNGNYAYVDNLAEARKVLVEQASGTLVTIAKDVKIQIEFNPKEVESFRLLGYENRVLSHRDFNDDRKDAGEIGADHRVTALYEIVPTHAGSGSPDVDPLKYQAPPARAPVGPGELATVKLRYKTPEGSTSELFEVVARDEGTGIARASADMRFAAAVAELGMLLRNSPHKGRASYDEVLDLATGAGVTDERRSEFVSIARVARSLEAPK